MPLDENCKFMKVTLIAPTGSHDEASGWGSGMLHSANPGTGAE